MPHRRSILDNGRCLDCQGKWEPTYKVWLHVEEICEELDHYRDEDLSYGAVMVATDSQAAHFFAGLLQDVGQTIAERHRRFAKIKTEDNNG